MSSPLDTSAAESQAPVVAFLENGAARVETHAAYVFLKGDTALKLKKAIRLPYLDYSTVALRKAALEREFEINRPMAPQIYRRVLPVTRDPAGGLRIGGDGEVVDWLLDMQRFPDKSLLSDVAERGELTDELALELAEVIADAHGEALPSDRNGVSIMVALEEQLVQAFGTQPETFPQGDFERFASLYSDRFRHLKPVLLQRAKRGLVRRCHGDLHCSNVVILEGRPVLFDAIEFSERIATTDVLYDLAFLLMDLLRRKQARAANLILNRYFDLRRKDETLHGAATLPLFLATRAGVRAIVAADKAKEMEGEAIAASLDEARGYFARAIDHLAPHRSHVIVVGGLSGTGKTVLARTLATHVLPQPGAFHIRSDIERKRLYRLPAKEALPEHSYTPETSAEVYQAMLARAEEALAAGWPVVLDAVFAKPQERKAVEELAHRHGAAFTGLWLEAAAEDMKARVAGRKGDASDATPDVVEKQLAYDLGAIDWHHIDAAGTPKETYARAARVMAERKASTSSTVL